MGDFLRSEKMVLCQIYIPTESAYFVISELGEIGLVQFRDLNSDVPLLQRMFVTEVLRCYDLESKLKYIADHVKESNIKIYKSRKNARARLSPNEFRDIETQITQSETEIRRLIENTSKLQIRSTELKEFKAVLTKSEAFLKERDEIFGLNLSAENPSDFVTVALSGVQKVNFITGVIYKERARTFETTLWRITKGNVLYKCEEMEEPIINSITGTKQYKTVFVICYHGDQIKSKLVKLAVGFQASLYTCPNSAIERQKLLQNIVAQISEIKLVIDQTDAFRKKLLVSVANQLQYWTIMVRKTKAIFHTLNFMTKDITRKCFIGECWIGVQDIAAVKQAFADGKSSSLSISPFLDIIETDEIPPTYFKTNKFTYGFQHIIDVYGMASYREVNPALFSITTFPFLFAIMYGDMGHATVMTLFALYLIIIEKKVEEDIKVKSEVFTIFFTGRYMILLMGLFSLYTGFIYNDCFSISINISGSKWFVKYNKTTIIENDHLELHPHDNYKGTPYVFGIDPIWKVAHNTIIFLNSYKMKMSIIFGVFHMILGLCINVKNFRYFKEPQNIFLEFIPKLTLLCCLFLWLVIMMIIKWILYSADNKELEFGTACAPSILVSFIDMMLMKVNPQARFSKCSPFLFKHQSHVQIGLLSICAVTLPVMLAGKPLYALYERKHARKKMEKKANDVERNTEKGSKKDKVDVSSDNSSEKNKKTSVEEVEKENSVDEDDKDGPKRRESFKNSPKNEKEEDFGEIVILSVIDTIEYTLSTVSHTASYLRLWALSLAHNELSIVLWDQLLRRALRVGGGMGAVKMFVIFTFWMMASLVILIIMEGLSAFLHTLRLHWVEFMSKFYNGGGYAFEPFSFKTILKKEEIDNSIY